MPRGVLLIIGFLLLVAGCAGPGAPAEPSNAPGPAQRCAPAPPAPKPGYLEFFIYYTCTDDVPPAAPRRVARQVLENRFGLRVALDELLKGPTEAERNLGLVSWFSSQTAGMLNSVEVTPGGRAVVDFKDFSSIIPNASTSAGAGQLVGELARTVFEFPSIQEVEFRFDGSCAAFWGWLQADCQVLPAARFR